MKLKHIAVIAEQEAVVAFRNRWVIVFGSAFALLVTAIALGGVIAEGYSGIENYTRTSVSILNLILYLVPLMALLNAASSFTGDRGSSELLYAQPIDRSVVVVGKALGLLLANGVAIVGGYAAAGTVIGTLAGVTGLLQYSLLMLLSLLLNLSFLSIGSFITILLKRRMKAYAYVLFAWFLFVIFYDLVVMTVALQFSGPKTAMIIFASILGNPVDLVRVASLIALDSASIYGAAGASLLRMTGNSVMGVVIAVAGLVFWICLPMVLAVRVMQKQDIT